MLGYIAARLVLTVPLLLGLSLAIFLLSAAAPGDPVLMLLGEGAPPEEVERLRARLGLDLPLHQQYLHFVGQALQGDLGLSYRSKLPVLPTVLERFPATLELALAGLAFALPLGCGLGLLAAMHRGGLPDRLAVGLAVLGSAIPVFWSGLLLILLFALTLNWLPASGRGGPQHLVLPALTLGVGAAALLARLTRASLLEALAQDYTRTARGKGLAERSVLLRHVLRNAAIPIAAAIGLQLGGLLGGAVLTETVFAWPGLGRLTVQAVEQRDYPMLRAAILVATTAFTLLNLALDLLFAWLDPRVRYR